MTAASSRRQPGLAGAPHAGAGERCSILQLLKRPIARQHHRQPSRPPPARMSASTAVRGPQRSAGQSSASSWRRRRLLLLLLLLRRRRRRRVSRADSIRSCIPPGCAPTARHPKHRDCRSCRSCAVSSGSRRLPRRPVQFASCRALLLCDLARPASPSVSSQTGRTLQAVAPPASLALTTPRRCSARRIELASGRRPRLLSSPSASRLPGLAARLTSGRPSSRSRRLPPRARRPLRGKLWCGDHGTAHWL